MSWSGNHPKTLDGIRILDFTRLLPGPFGTMLLADLGADVVKIEAPEGGDYARWYPPMFGSGSNAMGAFFASINRGKRSLSINLKTPRGVDLLRKLASTADVLIESFRPGVMSRLGLGPEDLRQDNRGLIYCAISGYGQTGPFVDRAGHDLNYLAVGGALEQTAAAGEAPHPPGFQLADIFGGGMYAALSIVAALFSRERRGEGAELDISMTDGAATTLAPLFARLAAGDRMPKRGEDQLTGALPCYRVYPTADDKFMSLGALEPKFWTGFCLAVGKSDWVHRGFDSALTKEVKNLFRTKSRDEWALVFADHDVCCEPVLDASEAMETELFRARNFFFELGAPDRAVTFQTATPVTPIMSQQALLPPPKLGEHSVEVLAEAGLDDAEIRALLDDSVIKVSD